MSIVKGILPSEKEIRINFCKKSGNYVKRFYVLFLCITDKFEITASNSTTAQINLEILKHKPYF